MAEIIDVRHLARTPDEAPKPRVVDVGKNEGVLLVFKAASRSILAAGKIADPDKGSLPKKVHVFVRDPLERVISGYRFFSMRNLDPRGPFRDRELPKIESYEDYVDNILSGDRNVHWEPVADLIERFGKPVIIHRFEDMQAEFPNGIQLERRNESKPVHVNEGYRYDELREFYAADYALRNS